MRRILALMLLFCLLFLSGCAPEKQLTRYTHTFYDTFDTVVIFVGYAESEETFNKAAELCESEFRRYHNMFNAYRHASDTANIWYLNENAWKQPVQVHPDMMELLLFCKEQAAVSNTVNPAMGRVLRLWHNAREDAESDPFNTSIPELQKLQEAALHTSLDDLVLDEQTMTVWYDDTLLRLDLGAVAKGYAAGKVAEQIAKIMPVFSINAGGNIVMGNSYRQEGWKVGIQNPNAALFISDNPYLCTLKAENCSIVTSGDYQRYFYADGKAWHHLIDPETLMPAEYYRAVTIVAPTSSLADWYSTAVFLLPYEESRALVESAEGVEALWLFADGTMQTTQGFEAMIVEETKE